MKFTQRLLLALLISASFGASAEKIDMRKCEYEFKATRAALGMRDHGKTKEEMEATLPPRERTKGDPQADLLHTILDDIYKYPEVSAFPYFHYRGLVCLTRAQGVAVSVPFDQVSDKVIGCQREHGTEESTPLTDCILKAVQEHL